MDTLGLVSKGSADDVAVAMYRNSACQAVETGRGFGVETTGRGAGCIDQRGERGKQGSGEGFHGWVVD